MRGMTTTGATKKTEAKWAERVRAWRASGETAEEFAERQGYAPSTLQVWSSRVARAEAPRFLRVVPQPKAAAAVAADAGLVVEVGSSRVRVTTGFDAALLVEVVRVLGGER
jgi:hypothetical protein